MQLNGPFHYLRNYMIVTGVLELPNVPWPLNNAVTVLNNISGINLSLSGLLYCFTEEAPFFDNMQGFLIFICTGHVLSKTLVFSMRRKKVQSIMEFMDQMYKESSFYGGMSELHLRDLWYSRRVFEGIVVSFSALHAIGNTISVVNHFLGSDMPPLQMYIPFQKEGNFYWVCLYCVGISVFGVLNLGMVLSTLITFILASSTQMVYLRKRLEKLGEETSNEEVNSCIVLHQKVLKNVNDVNDFLSTLLFFEYLLTSLQCCLSGYRLFVAEEDKTDKMVGVTIFILTIIVPFVNCFGGEIIKNQSENIFLSAYENTWYQMDVKNQKKLNTLLLVASRPQTIQFKHLLVFDMILFGVILKGSYSLITALQTVGSN